MPTSKVHTARSVVPGATTSKSSKASAKKSAAAKSAAAKSAAAKSAAAKSAAAKSAAAKSAAAKSAAAEGHSASQLIDKRIAELRDWRGQTLSRMRKLIKEADPDVVEEWKWMGTPVWSHDGIICTGESYKSIVKLTFAKGATLPDPAKLFNSSLDGNVRRAIDIHDGDKIDARAFKALIRAAITINASNVKARSKRAK